MPGPNDRSAETQAAWVTASPAPTRDADPVRIADRYTIEAQIGVGGMGTVYRARDHELDEVVALKVMRPEIARRPGLLDRFRQEVKLARRVTHPNVVRTYDLGEYVCPEGIVRPFLTMELVDGPSLARLLAEEGALTPARAEPIVQAICAGLQAAHDARVLHRDLKPDNVLVGAGSRAVITDFGIARVLADPDAASRTAAGGIVGTPAYMAPEQVRAGAPIDHRVDVYAVGAILFELLTGRRAWEGTDPFQVAVSRAVAPPPDPRAVRPDLPDAVARVVIRCLAPSPDDRYPSARAVAEAFAQALRAAPAMPTPTPLEPIAVPFERASSLAVLPFRTSTPEDAPLGEGLAEELVDAFSMTRGLRVRPLGAHREAATTGNPRELGRKLEVETVVEGSIRRTGDRFRVTVRAVSVRDGFQIGAWRFESPDPLSIADEAAATVARALTVELSVPTRPTTPPAATELYLRGKRELRANWYRPDRALPLLEQAHALAPTDPAILAEYATAVARSAMFGSGAHAEVLARAKALSERAVAQGPDRGETWFALGQTRFAANDVVGATAAYGAALQRSPGHVQAQEAFAAMLLEAGAIDEAVVRLRAVIAADPEATRARTELVRAYALLGDWDHARRVYEGSSIADLGRHMTWARLRLWNPDLPAGPLPSAVEPGAPEVYQLPIRMVQLLTRIHDERAADPVEVTQILTFVRTNVGRLIATRLQISAEASAFVGQHEDALRYLEESVQHGLHDVCWLDRCPVLAPLRGDPRFAAQRAIVAARAAQVLAAARA